MFGGDAKLAACVMLGSGWLCFCVAVAWLEPWVLIFILFTDMCIIALNVNKFLGGSS